MRHPFLRQAHAFFALVTAITLGVTLPALAQGLASAEAEAAAPAGAVQRHAAWTALLQKYVTTDEAGLNRFDYGALKANPADREALDAYIDAIANQDWDSLSRDEQFVSWANLYNAVTVRHMVGRYPVKSIRSGYVTGPWKDIKITADGREVSLDDIEHGILRADWDEPRVHYTINCASVGCPNLMNRAWEAATLEEDLDAAARAFINSPRGVIVRKNGKLKVSSIYKWFKEDFGGNEDGVIAHLLTYASPELAEKIRARPDISSYDYDWAINDVKH